MAATGGNETMGREVGQANAPLPVKQMIDGSARWLLDRRLEGACVKKMRERHAAREMKVGPSEPSCRGRLQTAISCFGQNPRW
jgi:hypothetical protein